MSTALVAGEDAVRVRGELVPTLVILGTKSVSGVFAQAGWPDPSMHAGSGHPVSSFHAGKQPKTARVRTTNLNYYCCTKCGWMGNALAAHRKTRSSCRSFPCTLLYTKGTSAKETGLAFLARCTPKQRELGLPPDYAQPVRCVGPDGSVDPDGASTAPLL